jgi:glycerol-3-phosphate dehydrogenase
VTRQYDICVVGGGIQGCGVAQAAVAAGYSVVLLEKTSLASATSSRSSKLIHGGLRYLESGQFQLVAESIRERELLINNAPGLVRRVPFYIPLYKHTSRKSWQIFLGLSLYALFGRLKALACFRRLPEKDWSQLDGLTEKNLKSVYQYTDAQTDDVKLTRAVMHSAVELGAELICPARFQAACYENKTYTVTYEKDNQVLDLSCRVLINATGPWVNEIQKRISPQVEETPIELVQGAHIIIRQPAPKGVYYVESPSDRRAVFIMPWYGHTMIGTTETPFEGDPAKIEPTEHELDYLQNIVKYYFPSYDDQIIHSFAGVRVLPKDKGSMFNRTRETVYFTAPGLPGYIALMGGKLTGYRATAEKVMEMSRAFLSVKEPVADTREIMLEEIIE